MHTIKELGSNGMKQKTIGKIQGLKTGKIIGLLSEDILQDSVFTSPRFNYLGEARCFLGVEEALIQKRLYQCPYSYARWRSYGTGDKLH